VVELIVIGATLALAAGASGVEGWRRIAGARALDRFARWKSCSYAPPTQNVKSARAFGTRAGIAFAIDFCRVRGTPHTRVVVDSPAARLARVTVQRRRDSYIVHGLDAADSGVLLSSCSKVDRDVVLSSDGRRVTVVWRGLETDPIVLDSAVDLAIAASRFERPEAPYR
jgi:hypothetical protein